PLLLVMMIMPVFLPFSVTPIFLSTPFRLVLLGMVGLIFYYFYFCIRMLQKHKVLIKQNYSGVTGSITINWMVVIITLQIAEFILKGVLGTIPGVASNQVPIITNEYCFIIETFLLVVLGIWQKSIPVFVPEQEDAAVPAMLADDLKRYQLKLEKYMTE